MGWLVRLQWGQVPPRATMEVPSLQGRGLKVSNNKKGTSTINGH